MAPKKSTGAHNGSIIWLCLALAYLIFSLTNHLGYAAGVVILMLAVVSLFRGNKWLSLLSIAVPAMAYYHWPDTIQLIAYLPPLGAFLFMAGFFFHTLTEGHEALITQIARKEHPNLPQEIADYSRTLTWIWAATFLGLFISSATLALSQPLDKWSHWVHGMGYAVPALLFLGEYLYRHHRFRNIKHHSLLALIINTTLVIKEISLAGEATDKTKPQKIK